MRIRTAFLAAAIAALPVLAMAQTAAPTEPGAAQPPAAATPAKPHREHGDWHKRHAEMRAKYEQLSAADKAKFDELTKQMKQIRHERMQLLGVGKS
jgi:Spy/CpxP family protein refolding chaperone